MTIYGQTLGVFKRENNECIRNGEKTNLHKIKNVVFLISHMWCYDAYFVTNTSLWQFEAKPLTTNYCNRVVHVFKAFFYKVLFIYVESNPYFWSRSHGKKALLWPLLRKKTYCFTLI